MTKTLTVYQKKIIACDRCDRLRKYCAKIAKEKKKQFAMEPYWGKPVPGFGDPDARLVIVGLAPAAHGANRTGRMFTGDRSGEWLYRALFEHGFSQKPLSASKDDGLTLKDAYITSIVKCAPPDNLPLKTETQNCLPHLNVELSALNNKKVFIVLGHFAYQHLWQSLNGPKHKPKFEHGKILFLEEKFKLILSYHPSQQNTFTKRLTKPMFDQVFKLAHDYLVN